MSGGDLILKVEDVWKRYSRSQQTNQKRAERILFDSILPWGARDKRAKDEVDVVKGVSFELRRGEALGVIGLNGAGKTTLLRMLSGQLLPDRGSITARGSTGTLVDLTSGFVDSMPGRANVFMRSALLGRKRAEVEASLNDIVAFAELEEAIDAPVASYSSGMRMRLAFATTIFMQPDLLLVDEVLSVGDFKFRQKCLERVRRMRAKSAFVLVSHSMNDISRFCDQVIVLKQGRIDFMGVPDAAISHYYDAVEKRADAAAKGVGKARAPLGEFIHRRDTIEDVGAEWRLPEGQSAERAPAGGSVDLHLRFTLKFEPRNLIVGVPIYSKYGELLTALSSDQMQVRLPSVPGAPQRMKICVDNLPLAPGRYRAVLAIVDGPEYLYRQPIDDLVVTRGALPKYWGEFVLSQRWEV